MLERRQRHSGFFIVNFQQIFTPCSDVSTIDFEQESVGRESDLEN